MGVPFCETFVKVLPLKNFNNKICIGTQKRKRRRKNKTKTNKMVYPQESMLHKNVVTSVI